MAKKNKKKLVRKGKWWFRFVKVLMKSRYKAPEFVYLDGKPFEDGSVIISNHEGTDAPMSVEMYLDKPVRFWGAHEMNSGLIKMYKYQTRVYYHEKKHWNLHLARLFCLLASPLTNMFYAGLDLISTYTDARLYKTIKESIATIQDRKSIMIYPEDSSKGYLAELEGFYGGFMLLAEACAKQNIDVPIVVSYFRKEQKIYVFDKPIKYSELVAKYQTRENIIEQLLNRCNELGSMDLSQYLSEEQKQVA